MSIELANPDIVGALIGGVASVLAATWLLRFLGGSAIVISRS